LTATATKAPEEPAPPPVTPPLITPAAARPSLPEKSAIFLSLGFVIAAITLFVLGPTALTPVVIPWPWTLTLCIGAVGFAVSVGGVRRSGLATTVLLVGLGTLVIYAATLLAVKNATFPTAQTAIAVACIGGAVLNAGVCVAVVTPEGWRARGSDPLLAVLSAGLVAGFLLSAIAIEKSTVSTTPQPLWDTVCWVSIATGVVSLLAAYRAWRAAVTPDAS
jgi:hypothetical protein